MRLFISYGYDDNADLVKRITADLRTVGHDPWIDSEQIHRHGDWRRALVEALGRSDWTVAFLSAHAMRPGGVTAQEIGFAEHEKGGCITTVLLEPMVGWSVPVGIGRAQWVDMSEWRAQQANGDASFAAWYAECLAALLHRLRPEAAAAHAAEMAKLSEWLQPVRQHPETDPRIEGFVGRKWLIARVEAWRLQPDASRMFWLHGAPGCGKSAFAAWITAQHLCNVVALNLCDWRLVDRRDPLRVISTLAWQLARRVAELRPRLVAVLGPLMEKDDKGVSGLDRLDAFARFDRLIIQPLKSCGIDGGQSADRLLLVLDGLDETVAAPAAIGLRQPDATLVKLLANQGPLLPTWVGLLVTSRPEQPMSRDFAGLPYLRVDAETAENRADLLTYAMDWLKPLIADEVERERLAEATVDRAQGSFIYLRKLQELQRNQPCLPLDPDRLPVGLDALYGEWFERQFGNSVNGNHYRRVIAPALGLIVAAQTPIPRKVLKSALGWSAGKLEKVLERLGGLFEENAGSWNAFHQSVEEWLADAGRSSGTWCLDVPAARERLGRWLWRSFVDGNPESDAFVLAEMPAILPKLPSRTLSRLWLSEADRDLGFARLSRVMAALREAGEWESLNSHCELAACLASSAGAAGNRLLWHSQIEFGDRALRLNNLARASTQFRASMANAERRAAADPANAGWQRELWVSYQRIGLVLRTQGQGASALAEFRTSLAIAQRLAAAAPADVGAQIDLFESHAAIGNVLMAQGEGEAALAEFRAARDNVQQLANNDPANTILQRELSSSHLNIGHVLMSHGADAAALAEFRASIAIGQRLAAANPTNVGLRHDLSVSHRSMGDVLVAQGEGAAALEEFRASMTIRQRLIADDPTNASWQRDLSVSIDRIGMVLLRRGEGAAALAEFRASMTIRQRLAAADPINALWQGDVSAAHVRIGDALLEQGEGAAALAEFRASLAIAQRLANEDPTNANWQHDLSVSQDRIGNMLLAQGEGAAALHEFRACMAIRQRLTVADNSNAGWQRDFISILVRTRNLELRRLRLLRAWRTHLRLIKHVMVMQERGQNWRG
jgi:tetratricopeptide (TPR) repeat protein